jgi:hypothetical protein
MALCPVLLCPAPPIPAPIVPDVPLPDVAPPDVVPPDVPLPDAPCARSGNVLKPVTRPATKMGVIFFCVILLAFLFPDCFCLCGNLQLLDVNSCLAQ